MKLKLIATLLSLIMLSSCDGGTTSSSFYSTSSSFIQQAAKYDANVSISFSVDDGSSYASGRRVLPVGKIVFMKIYISVAYNDEDNVDLINAQIQIPNVEGIEASYNTGQKLTPDEDIVNKYIEYRPQFIARKIPGEYELVFKFIPLSAGSQKIRVIFDEKLLPIEDYEDTVTFVSNEG